MKAIQKVILALMVLLTSRVAFAGSPTTQTPGHSGDFKKAIEQTQASRDSIHKEFLRLAESLEPATDDDVSVKYVPAASRGIASVSGD